MKPAQQSIPILTVAGGPAERGAAIGAAFQQKISIAAEFYAKLFRLSEADLRLQGTRFSNVIRDFSPEFAIEIEACAEASGTVAYRLFAMNARSEILTMTGVPECTAVGFQRTSVLGQTWDWAELFEDLFVIVRQILPDGRRFLTVTEPGMLAKIGLSAAGIGVCLNFLGASRPWRSGIPVHVFLRAVLECPDWSAVRQLTDRCASGVVGNILTMSANGDIMNIEGAAEIAHITVPAEDIFVHTNHYLGGSEQAGAATLIGNSVGRLDAAKRLSAGVKTHSIAELKALLSDREQGPISCPYTPFAGIQVGTVCAVAMDLRALSLHIRKGPNPVDLFEMHHV